MPNIFEGGCRVNGLKEGRAIRDGALKEWHHFGHNEGAQAISLRILELPRRESVSIRSGDWDEALYVLSGSGIADHVPIHVDTAIYLRPRSLLMFANDGAEPLILASSQCPASVSSANTRPAIIRLEDRPILQTGDRWYREMINEELGSPQMTQFVGSIPPGRTPDHFHLYEEVICILKGTGVFHSGNASTPIGVGSCMFLPRQQPHCLENTGSDELRLLGVFYPAGSPTARDSA